MPVPLIIKLFLVMALGVIVVVSLWRVGRFMGKEGRRAQKNGIICLAAVTGMVMVGGNGWSVSCFAPLAGIAVLAVTLGRSKNA